MWLLDLLVGRASATREWFGFARDSGYAMSAMAWAKVQKLAQPMSRSLLEKPREQQVVMGRPSVQKDRSQRRPQQQPQCSSVV